VRECFCRFEEVNLPALGFQIRRDQQHEAQLRGILRQSPLLQNIFTKAIDLIMIHCIRLIKHPFARPSKEPKGLVL
jgi:hypothetical protein